MEIELKYSIDNEAKIEKIFNDKTLLSMKDKNSDEVINMHAVYFDTEDKALYNHEIALRNRREDDKTVSTIKWNGCCEDGMHRREELNVPVEHDEDINKADISLFSQSDIMGLLAELTDGKELKPFIDMNFTRRQIRVDTGKSISEVSADFGKIHCGDKSTDILELEIELYSGDEADMTELGHYIAEKYSLEPGNISKFKRGMDLL